MNVSKELKKSSSKVASSFVIKHSVGIDMSKEKFEVCYKTIDTEQRTRIKGSRCFANSPSGFRAFYAWSEKRKEENIRQVFTLEATGVYYENLAFYLYDLGLHVSVVLPNRSKKYFQMLGIKSKTDKIDASGLSQMGAEQNLSLWHRPDDWTVALRQSTRQREQLQETRTVLLNQKESLTHSSMPGRNLLEHVDRVLVSIENELKLLEHEMLSLLHSDPFRKEKIKQICKIKGVGELTVAILLGETNCFEDFHSSSQLVSYAGYDVIENQSGKHTGPTKISKRGNAHIRRAMHLPAFSIKMYEDDPVLVGLWDRVYDRTRKKMKAYVAVQRKLLVLIYTLWKKDVEYVAGYRTKPCTEAGLN